MTTLNYTIRSIETAFNEFSAKSRCFETSLRRRPVVRFSEAATFRKRPLNLRIPVGCLREVRLYRDFTRTMLVFWIGGRLREVVAHGGSTVYIVNLKFRESFKVILLRLL